ncbi:MAG: undecaprenyl-phosphate glucose phosphotransferase [Porticoccaceae bacterium]|nr:undecaprenyl-phosphate glucose phosphotransferase [Porticoccaceae bacterium]
MNPPQTAHRQYRRGLTFFIQWLVAMGVLLILLAGLTIIKGGHIDPPYLVLMVLTPLLALPIYSILRVYNRYEGYLTGAWKLILAWLTVLVTLGAVGFVSKTSAVFSREVILQWAVLGMVFQVIAFGSLHKMARLWSARDENKTNTAIIGVGQLANRLVKATAGNETERLVGLISHRDSGEVEIEQSPAVLGDVSQLSSLLASHNIEKLYIALSITDAEKIEALYIELLDMNVDVIWMPNLEGLILLNHSISDIAGMPAIHLNESPLTAYRRSALIKTTIDKVLALSAVIVLLPVFILTAIVVKLSSPGPVLFKQKRLGWNGKIIEVWKFRSMYLHDDQQVKQATQSDSRITKVGKFIRRTSIDELPQFFNVLQGRMSLVGPRPHALEHNNYYTDKIDAYMARHRIKPGITGLAQINGCRGETETVEQMKARVDYDLSYINNWSVGQDIKILLKTPLSLLARDIY